MSTLKRLNLKKGSRRQQKHEKLPGMERVNAMKQNCVVIILALLPHSTQNCTLNTGKALK